MIIKIQNNDLDFNPNNNLLLKPANFLNFNLKCNFFPIYNKNHIPYLTLINFYITHFQNSQIIIKMI